MKKIYLTINEINKLKKLKKTRESTLYLLKGKKKILKLYSINIEYDKELKDRKLITLHTLDNYKNILSEIKELVLPEYLITTDIEDFGFTSEYINHSITLKTLLTNQFIPPKIKVQYLSQVGILIEKLNSLNIPYKIHFNDLHEENFLVSSNGELKSIDIDGLHTSNNKTISISKYLYLSPNLENLEEKYKRGYKNRVIPSYNSDLFCFNIMILNTLTGLKTCSLPINYLHKYLEYLEFNGIPLELIESIKNIYTNNDNINPTAYLQKLSNLSFIKAHHHTYLRKTKINLPLIIGQNIINNSI